MELIDEKGLQDVQVYQLCEYDAVAAYSLDEAISWYKETTGLSDDELYNYDDIEIVSPDRKVYVSEDSTELTTVRELLNTYWNGKPFIAVTTS